MKLNFNESTVNTFLKYKELFKEYRVKKRIESLSASDYTELKKLRIDVSGYGSGDCGTCRKDCVLHLTNIYFHGVENGFIVEGVEKLQTEPIEPEVKKGKKKKNN